MAYFPLEPCPHCPVDDPVQRLLETTSFYNDDDNDTDDDDDDDDVFDDKASQNGTEICRLCSTSKEIHYPPYGPWCSVSKDKTASIPSPPPPPPPRIRRFRSRNLQPLVDACLGTGSIGSVFLAIYRQKKIGAGLPEDVFNLVIKRIGTRDVDFFAENRKSLDPTLTNWEEKIKKLKHPHLIKVFAIIGGNKVVMERAPFGSLIDLLQDGASQSRMNSHHLTYVAYQAASGMAYLEKNAFVHGRLSARNILVNEVSRCKRWIHIKLTDFGIPIDTEESRGSRLPWTSPEEMMSSFSSTSSSSSSDCWSFGVVLHEIFTFGKTPYNGLNNVTLKKWVPQGYRMLQSPLVPDKIYAMMLECWHPAALQRPSFHVLETRLWNKIKELTPDFLCGKCGDKSLAGGIATRNR